jgi:hypothetical protein
MFNTESGELGGTMALNGERIISGAPFYLSNNPGRGVAFVFRNTGTQWVQESRLDYLPHYNLVDLFGRHVALDDKLAVVEGGRVHVFRRTGTIWSHEQELASLSEHS